MPGEASTCNVCGRPVYREGLCEKHFREEVADFMKGDIVALYG